MRQEEEEEAPRRSYWHELVLLQLRFGVFLLFQFLCVRMAQLDHEPPRYPISGALLTASYCWVIVCSAYAMQLLLARLAAWRHAYYHQQHTNHPTEEVPSLVQEEEEENRRRVRREEEVVRPIFRITEEDDPPIIIPESTPPHPSWSLRRWWYGLFFCHDPQPASASSSCHYMTYTAVFVASYSLGGVFWFPQLSMLWGTLGSMLWHAKALWQTTDRCPGTYDDVDGSAQHQQPSGRRRRSLPLCHCIGLWLLIIALSVFAIDLWGSDAQEGEDAHRYRELWLRHDDDRSHAVQRMTRNLWLGGVVPAAVGWLSTTGGATATAEGTPVALLTSAIPTLSLLSITYLTLHFPEQQQQLLLLKGRNNTTTTTAIQPPNAGMMQAFLVNASRLYYELVVASPSVSMGMATVAPPELSLLGTLLFFATPSVMWLALAILLGSGMLMMTSAGYRVGSTLGVYVLATIVRRLVVDGRLTATVCTALVLTKLGLGCVLHTELNCLGAAAERAVRG